MKRDFLILIFLIYTLSGVSQGKISGNVVYLNSGSTPAEGVEIRAAGSNGAYSNSNGVYSLYFPNKKPGATVYPEIGTTLVKNGSELKAIELVNFKEVEFFNIPTDPNKSPLKIVVCPKGFRNNSALKYYKLIKLNSEELIEKKTKEINELKTKLGESNSLVNQLKKEFEILKKNNDSTTIYSEALEIASINKDDANSRMLEFLEALDAGVSLDIARKLLSTKKAFSEALQSENQIVNSLEEINRDCSNLIRIKEFDLAIQKYDTISLLLKRKLFDPNLLVDNLIKAGEFCRSIYYDKLALKYYSEALTIINNSNLSKIKEVKILSDLGFIYYEGENHKKSKIYLDQAIKILDNLKDNNSTELASIKVKSLTFLGLLYFDSFEDEKAQETLEKAWEILISLKKEDKPNINCGIIFGNLLEIYENSEKDKEKLIIKMIDDYSNYLSKFNDSDSDIYFQRLVYFKEQIEPYLSYKSFDDIGNKLLSKLYSNFENKELSELRLKVKEKPQNYAIPYLLALKNYGRLYLDLKEYEKSKKILLEALRFCEKTSSVNIMDIADIKSILGLLYLEIEEYEISERVFFEAIEIYHSKSFKYLVANTKTNLANLYKKTRKFDEAKKLNFEAINIFRFLIENDSERYYSNLARSLAEIGVLNFELREYGDAKKHFLESVNIYRDLKDNNPNSFEYDYEYSDVLKYLGFIFYDEELFEKAIEFYEESLIFYKINPYEAAFLQGNLGYSYQSLNNYNKAIHFYSESLKSFFLLEKDDDLYNENIAFLYKNIGLMYGKIKQFNNSKIAYQNSLKIFTLLKKEGSNEFEYVIDEVIKEIELLEK